MKFIGFFIIFDEETLSRRSRIMSTRLCTAFRICADCEESKVMISLLSGVAHSAAAEGVGARISAAKSQIVKSVSCPTADITGTGEERIFLARSSLLKDQRSSIEPPPRPMIITSAGDVKPKYSSPARRVGTEPSP